MCYKTEWERVFHPLKMAPCSNADRWPDIIHPHQFFPFSSKHTNRHWTDRALLFAICLPRLAPEHVLPVWDLPCWAHHWLLTLTLLSRRQLISPSNRSVQHLIHISIMYSYLFSKSVLAYQMAKENIPCCSSLVSFCSCHKMILFHAELTLGLHIMQEKLFESRLSSC